MTKNLDQPLKVIIGKMSRLFFNEGKTKGQPISVWIERMSVKSKWKKMTDTMYSELKFSMQIITSHDQRDLHVEEKCEVYHGVRRNE